MQRDLNIALVQYDIEWQDIASNLRKLDVFFNTLSCPVDLIVLPEMFLTGFTMKPQGLAVEMRGPEIDWMRAKAVKYDALVLGSLIVREDGQYFNRCVLAYPDGTISYQDKRHLFSYAGEEKVFTPAKTRKVFEWRGWTLFCAVCYDLRFPVWSRNDLGYDLLIYVANWPKVRVDAWRRLLVARAIENQSYVIGVNRVGKDGNGLIYDGHSAVLDFQGDSLVSASNNEVILYAKASRQALLDYRARYRFLDDKDAFGIRL